MLVVLEGVDKSGKHTQALLLTSAWGRDAKLFSFPDYESVTGKLLKRHLYKRVALMEERSRDSSDIRVDGDPYWARADEDALMFQCVMLADRCLVAPELVARRHANLTSICDRYWPSGYAYGGSDGLDDEWLLKVHEVLPQPDAAILIDVPVDVAMARCREGRPDDPDRYERDRAKLEVVRARYLELWERKRRGRSGSLVWQVVDGTQTREAVFADVKKAAGLST